MPTEEASQLFNLLGLEVVIDPELPAVVGETLLTLYARPALIRPVRHRVQIRRGTERTSPGAEHFTVRTHSSQVQVTPLPGQPEEVWIHAADHDAHLRLGFGNEATQLHVVSRPRMASAEAVMVALIEVFRHQGLLPLHAAAFEHSGRVTVLLGPSGTGKSTTLLRAIHAGATPITEDFALLDPATCTLVGLDEGLRCLPGTLPALPAGSEALPVVRGKQFAPWTALGRGHLWSATLDQIAELTRVPARPTGWTPLGRGEQAMSLWAATGVPLTTGTRAWTAQAIAGLVAELGVQQLNLGRGRVEDTLTQPTR